MRFISRKMHGVMDYLMGLVLIAAPWIFNFDEVRPAMMVSVALGVMALLYSLLTRYEWGLIRVIPFNVHLMLDFASGLVLAGSPWLFGFSETVYLPHLILGVLEVGASLMTVNDPAPLAPMAPGPNESKANRHALHR